MKSRLTLLLLFCIISCGDIVDPAPAHLNIPERKSLAYRWNLESLIDEPLIVSLSERYLDLFEKDLEDKDGYNPIEQMGSEWNKGHPVLDFFSLPFIRSEDKDYENLSDYRDDEIGIYLSYAWYKELSKRSLGITQFFGKRINAGTDKEYIELTHADIILNFRDHDYGLKGEDDKYDLYTVILHEMGHMIGLPHPNRLGNREAVMAPSLGRGEIKRKLLPPDLEYLFKAYPIEHSKYLYDIPDQTAPFNLYRDAPEERFIIELLEDGHKHYHMNGKFLSCEENIH